MEKISSPDGEALSKLGFLDSIDAMPPTHDILDRSRWILRNIFNKMIDECDRLNTYHAKRLSEGYNMHFLGHEEPIERISHYGVCKHTFEFRKMLYGWIVTIGAGNSTAFNEKCQFLEECYQKLNKCFEELDKNFDENRKENPWHQAEKKHGRKI